MTDIAVQWISEREVKDKPQFVIMYMAQEVITYNARERSMQTELNIHEIISIMITLS
jgi:hypothetical protein